MMRYLSILLGVALVSFAFAQTGCEGCKDEPTDDDITEGDDDDSATDDDDTTAGDDDDDDSTAPPMGSCQYTSTAAGALAACLAVLEADCELDGGPPGVTVAWLEEPFEGGPQRRRKQILLKPQPRVRSAKATWNVEIIFT
ncbi:MAG: hypothetical protein QF787_17845, partial [Nitrospinota bacterium]|nr:hypothetical protein [Nitrospinota bacterium]